MEKHLRKIFYKTQRVLSSPTLFQPFIDSFGFAPSKYSKGRSAEEKVALELKAEGYKTKLSKGSRGIADIIATKRGTKKFIQVKSGSAKISKSDRAKLRRMAKRHGADDVVANVVDEWWNFKVDFN